MRTSLLRPPVPGTPRESPIAARTRPMSTYPSRLTRVVGHELGFMFETLRRGADKILSAEQSFSSAGNAPGRPVRPRRSLPRARAPPWGPGTSGARSRRHRGSGDRARRDRYDFDAERGVSAWVGVRAPEVLGGRGDLAEAEPRSGPDSGPSRDRARRDRHDAQPHIVSGKRGVSRGDRADAPGRPPGAVGVRTCSSCTSKRSPTLRRPHARA